MAASSPFSIVYHHPFTPFLDLSLGWIFPLLFCAVSFPSTCLCMPKDPPLLLIVVITIHHRLSFSHPPLYSLIAYALVLPPRSPGHLIFLPLPCILNGFPVHVHTHIPPSCPCLWLYRLSNYLSASSFCPPPRSGRPSRWGCTGEGAREMEEGAKWRVICRSTP